MTLLIRDLRHGVRMSVRSPGFAALVVVVLTLGIGVNTAAFAIVNALLVRPLAGDGGSLVALHSHDRTRPGSYRPFSYPNYADIRDRGPFDALMAQSFATVALPSGGTMRRSFAAFVSSNYFDVLGVRLAAGRAFTADEERPGGGEPVVITNYQAWKATGLDPAFVGRTIRVNARDLTVVGVAPDGFTGTTAIAAPEVWLPLGLFDDLNGRAAGSRGPALADRARPVFALAGRLPNDVGDQAIQSRLDLLSRELADGYPAENRDQVLSTGSLARLTPGIQPESDAELTPLATLVVGLSGLVLFIACLNVANMLMARGASRRREVAIRASLGATRAAIVRQLLAENLVLSLSGAAGGLVVSYWAMWVFGASVGRVLPGPVALEPRPDLVVVAFTIVSAVAGTLVFGLGPALQASRLDVIAGLKQSSSGPAVRRFANGRNAIVVAQIALSVGLLAAGGMFAKATIAAAASDPGFPYQGALLASMDGSLAGMDDARAAALYREALERARRLPGVAAAGLASTVPFGDTSDSRQVRPVGTGVHTDRRAIYRAVSADYFRSLGVPLARGREFTQGEERAASAVAIIDESLGRELFPGGDALGQSVAFVPSDDDRQDGAVVLQVVGIAPPIREDVTAREAVPHIYVPSGAFGTAAMHLHVRIHEGLDPAAALEAIGREIRAVDPRLPVVALTTFQAFHDRALPLWVLRVGGTTLMLLAALAVALAVAGVYGVRSYIVSSRTRELCIRMAIGASRRDVLRLVLRDAAGLIAAGVALGMPLALIAAFALNAVLWGLTGVDPLVMASVPALLALATLGASYVPARRAARLNPMTVLRGD